MASTILAAYRRSVPDFRLPLAAVAAQRNADLANINLASALLAHVTDTAQIDEAYRAIARDAAEADDLGTDSIDETDEDPDTSP